MKSINLKNYEAYFLDFSEGNLSKTKEEELRDFLTQHPALKKELEEFEQPILAAENSLDYSHKNQLYREETTRLPLIDYLMVSQVENTISTTEKKRLAALLNKNVALLSDLAVYHKTKLTADESILFPNKKILIQKDNKFAFWAKTISSAAAAILLISLLNFNSADRQYRPAQFSYYATHSEGQSAASIQPLLVFQENQKSNLNNTKLGHDARKDNLLKAAERIQVSKIQTLTFRPISSTISPTIKKGLNMKNAEKLPAINKPELIAQNDMVVTNNQFLSLTEIAAKKIKTDVLKNKSLKENILEELVDLSNNRLSLPETEIGKTQRFAINLGKFSYSNF